MKKRLVLLLLVLLPAALYGGVRGYLWYSVKDTVSQVQKMLTGQGFLSYREVRSPVLGPIGVTGVTFTPRGFNQSIEIGSVLAHWDEPEQLIKILEAFYKKQLPAELKLSLNRINIPLTGEFAAWFDAPGQLVTQPIPTPASLHGCGNGAFSSTDLRNMGYESLTIDLRLEYARRGLDQTSFLIRMRSHDMMALTLEGRLPSGAALSSTTRLLSSGVSLGSISLTYDDESYNKRMLKYCTERTGKPEQQFVDDHVQQLVDELGRYQMAPSDELIAVYRQYLTDPVTLTISLNPYEPLAPGVLYKLDRDNFVDWLGLEISADGKPVKEIRAALQPEIAEEEAPPQQHEETFQMTPVAELTEHVGRLARIRTKTGVLEGYLEKANSQELVLTQSLSGGSFTFVVEVEDVALVEVLY